VVSVYDPYTGTEGAVPLSEQATSSRTTAHATTHLDAGFLLHETVVGTEGTPNS
jgi:hypothetical protein